MKSFFFSEKMFAVFDSVYEPAEDSFLLVENVKVKKDSKCFDLGCGSGIQTINMLLQGAKVLAVDVNEKALENTLHNVQKIIESNGIASENTLKNAKKINLNKMLETRKSNLFENIKRSEKFDFIVFNPPYVPSDEKKFVELDGGKKGREILDVFLREFSAHLKVGGICYFLQSSLNGEQKTKQILQKKKLNSEIIARKKLFFEELMVFKVLKEK